MRIKAMSNLDRMLELASHGTSRAQGQVPATREMKDVPVTEEPTQEAVGEFADPILDLCDELECDSDHPVLGELIRYLDGDTIKDFVADFRRHNDMNGDMEESLEEDSNKELALKDWYQNWSHHTGGNGDELPKGWFKAELDSGITTDGIEQSELDMNWEEDRLPITDAMKDDFKSIMGNDDEETLRIAYDICRELWEAVTEAKAKPDFADIDKDGDKDEDMKKAAKDKEDLDEAQSPAQKAAFAKMLASKGGKKADESDETDTDDKEELDESPTMDTTQLINLMKNSGLSEEAIETKLTEWANTPDGAAEEEATSHGEPYENFAQSVNLSLKRYLDAEDMKVGLKEHKVDDIKEAYKNAKSK